MFALIFIWTPPHFWALALFVRTDYGDANVPMLTVTHGHKVTRRHILIYTALLAPVAIWLALTPVGGPVTLLTAIGMNAWFLKGAFDIWRRDDASAEADNYKAEKSFFRVSLIYLFAHFSALLIDTSLRAAGVV